MSFFQQLETQIAPILIGTLITTIPLMVTALGGLFSEKSGVINIGLEGMMVFGGFGAALVMPNLTTSMPWYLVIIIGFMVGMLFSLLLGLLHAFLTIKLKINQIISGTAINIIAPAVTFYFVKLLYGTYETPRINFEISPIQIAPGAIISYDKIMVIVMAIIILIATIIIFKKTRIGRHLEAVGQNPQASGSVGIPVNRLRVGAVLASSLLAGFGGVSMVILVVGKLTLSLIAGYGFLALAILIFSGWSPIKCLIGSILFAFFISLIPSLSTIIATLDLSSASIDKNTIQGVINLLLETAPYIIAIIILMVFSRNNKAPKALGENYDKEQR